MVQWVGICVHVYTSFRGLDSCHLISFCWFCTSSQSHLIISCTPSATWSWSSHCISNFNVQKSLLEGLLKHNLLDITLSFWFWWSLKFCISNKFQGNADGADGPHLESIHYSAILSQGVPTPWPGQPSPREVLVSGEMLYDVGRVMAANTSSGLVFHLLESLGQEEMQKTRPFQIHFFELWVTNSFNLKHLLQWEEKGGVGWTAASSHCLSKITTGLWGRQIRFCSPGMQTAASAINLRRRLPW